MALTYDIPPSGEQVRIVGRGEITTADCIQMVTRVLSDPRHRPESVALIDLQEATYRPEDETEVIDIAATLEKFEPLIKNRIAIVARAAMIFPAELFSAHVRTATHVPVRVFADRTAAEMFCRERPVLSSRRQSGEGWLDGKEPGTDNMLRVISMTADRAIQFLAQQEVGKFPEVVRNPALLRHRLVQFGEGTEVELDGELDGEKASELAQVYEQEMDQAEAVYQALDVRERHDFVKAVKDTFPPSDDIEVEELDQALL